MDDPYSTAWLESEPISLNNNRIPEPPKKANFFSKAGKIRLSRIWEDKQLDVERLFTGIDEPSEAYVREKVSDYFQHYLFQRARRLSLGRRAITEIRVGGFRKDKRKFWEYEDFISAKNLKHDKLRRSDEVERITELLMAGRVKHAPEGFAEIFNDPIYKVNRLLDSVKRLERSEIKVNVIPFEIRTTKIKNVSQVPFEKPLLFRFNSTSPTEDVFQHNVTFNSESDEVFSSSPLGIQEIPVTPGSILTPGTPGMLPTVVSPGSTNGGCGYFVEFPTSDYERARSYSIMSELSDEELSFCAEKQFGHEEITGDLEISAEFSWEHAPLALAKNQTDCNSMYKMGSEIVQMFQRQEVAGDEFMEYITLKYFK